MPEIEVCLRLLTLGVVLGVLAYVLYESLRGEDE